MFHFHSCCSTFIVNNSLNSERVSRVMESMETTVRQLQTSLSEIGAPKKADEKVKA